MQPANCETPPTHEHPDVHPNSGGIHLLFKFIYLAINVIKHLNL